MRRIGIVLLAVGISAMVTSTVRWLYIRVFLLPSIPIAGNMDEAFWEGMPPLQDLIVLICLSAPIAAFGAYLCSKADE